MEFKFFVSPEDALLPKLNGPEFSALLNESAACHYKFRFS